MGAECRIDSEFYWLQEQNPYFQGYAREENAKLVSANSLWLSSTQLLGFLWDISNLIQGICQLDGNSVEVTISVTFTKQTY